MEERGIIPKVWINIILFILTVFSIFTVGISWGLNYKFADMVKENSALTFNIRLLYDSDVLFLSFLYTAVLILILLGHEFGHYLSCRYYNIQATLPYFIPAPPTLIGTLGAFIKIKSPITRKNQLFDIGIAGPLAGFFLSLPALVYGLYLSKIVPPLPRESSIVFGEPLLIKLIGKWLFGEMAQGQDILLHPLGFAGWVGVLVTSLNLFPVGQLDGGHIFYAVLGSKTKVVSQIVLAGFFVMGIFFWIGWFIWGFIILFFGLKHPRVADESAALSAGRKIVFFIILLIFIFSFIPDPIRGYNLFDFWRQLGL